jgi:hypothetical protein
MMLIRRTIDKPKRKFDLFISYLKKSNIRFKVEQPLDGLLEFNNFYIEEDFLAIILEVTRPTVRNWRLNGKIKPINTFHQTIDRAYFFNEKINGYKINYDETSNRRYRLYYYNIQDVYNFLWYEVHINNGGLRYPEDY